MNFCPSHCFSCIFDGVYHSLKLAPKGKDRLWSTIFRQTNMAGQNGTWRFVSPIEKAWFQALRRSAEDFIWYGKSLLLQSLKGVKHITWYLHDNAFDLPSTLYASYHQDLAHPNLNLYLPGFHPGSDADPSNVDPHFMVSEIIPS